MISRTRASAGFLAIAFLLAMCECGDDASRAGGAGAKGTTPGSTNPNGTNPNGTNPDGINPNGTNPNGTNPDGGNGTPPPPGGPTGEDDGLIPTTSIWRTTSEWFRPIDTAPPAEHSAQMIGALSQWGDTGNFQIDFSFNVLDGTGAPTVTIPQQEEGDLAPVPIPAKGYVEGDWAYDACPDGEDCHMIIFDRGASRLYELYQAHKTGSAWDAYLALWKLDKTYPRSNRGQGCTSGDAAGMAIAPGLIGYKETKKGAINHALRFIIKNAYIRGGNGDKNVPSVVYPASHGSPVASSATGIPYGGRLRLKTAIKDTDPRVTTPGAKALLRALQKYGMILSDGGKLPLVAESVKVHKDANPAETWSGLLGPHDLDFIRPSDFEVIAIPKDYPNGTPGWYQTKTEYEGQMKKPLGCPDTGVTQP